MVRSCGLRHAASSGSCAFVRSQDGSAVITAVVLAATLGLLATAAAGRAVSAATAAASLHDRHEARALAEYGLQVVLRDLRRAAGEHRALGLDVLPAAVVIERPVASEGSGTPPSTTVHLETDAVGRLRLRASATVGQATATASARVRPSLTSDVLWATEHAAVDPSLVALPRVACARPVGHPARDPACLDRPIGPLSMVGPVHSDEPTALATGTTFASRISTAALDPTTPDALGPLVPPQLLEAVATSPFGLEVRGPLDLPKDLEDLRETTPPTCRFRGPTLIRFAGADVHVQSPRSAPRPGDAASPDRAIGCLGVDPSVLVDGATVTLPDTAIIEVVRDDRADCVAHPLGIPLDEDTERGWWCASGDAFVWGRYDGSRSVRAEDNVQLVWDLEPADAQVEDRAVLGIIAGDSVVLRRPVGRPLRRVAPFGRNVAFAGPGIAPFGDGPGDAPTSIPATWEAPRITAALVALRGSVTIQNPFRGQPHTGSVRIEGSVASRFPGVFAWEITNRRGSVVARTGYALDLVDDPALRRSPPPGMPGLRGFPLRVEELDVG